jgi:lysophospholipase L1-like esterase
MVMRAVYRARSRAARHQARAGVSCSGSQPDRQMKSLCALTALALLAGCVQAPPTGSGHIAGAKYVAMGSSFAAGPGIPAYYEDTPAPCYRSTQNYAHQLARRLSMSLTDVSCSGATTAHLTGPRANIPPQLDALTPDTRLVTITIGGNDLGYIGGLSVASCAGLQKETGVEGDCPPPVTPPAEKTFADVAQSMDQIAKEVRRRAPEAQLVFVDYLAVLPETGTCAATPLSEIAADSARYTARRLAEITRKVAGDNGASIITASEFSKGHDACSADPWMHGYPRPGAPVAGSLYHPNLAGMTAVADALERLLR